MDFSRQDLVIHFGSWVEVQVAFYDFIFAEIAVDPEAVRKAAIGEFASGESFYEEAVERIADKFSTAEEAWDAFTKSLGSQHYQATTPPSRR